MIAKCSGFGRLAFILTTAERRPKVSAGWSSANVIHLIKNHINDCELFRPTIETNPA
jgi:hypothetical protein